MIGPARNQSFFDLNFPVLVAASCLLPLTGLVLCEVICVLFYFRQCTITICGSADEVWNFLPSVSVATGQLAPQKYIWRIFIALHATPRFLIAAGYHSMHKLMFVGNKSLLMYRHLSNVAYFLHVLEVLALVGLSFVSSAEDYDVHKVCFATFMLSATLHMMTVCVLHSFGKKAVQFSLTHEEKFSLKCKLILFVINALFFSAALYFFHRHNTYCEDGVYSLFGFCEIVVVMTNIAFHGTAIIDFRGSRLALLDFER
ncbi:hypothetical protein BsWGS_17893 [Bradybaena similaris]